MAADNLMKAFLVVIIGLALLPVVREFVALAVNGSSTSEAILLGLVSIFWVLAIIFIVVKMVSGTAGRR